MGQAVIRHQRSTWNDWYEAQNWSVDWNQNPLNLTRPVWLLFITVESLFLNKKKCLSVSLFWPELSCLSSMPFFKCVLLAVMTNSILFVSKITSSFLLFFFYGRKTWRWSPKSAEWTRVCPFLRKSQPRFPTAWAWSPLRTTITITSHRTRRTIPIWRAHKARRRNAWARNAQWWVLISPLTYLWKRIGWCLTLPTVSKLWRAQECIEPTLWNTSPDAQYVLF